MGRFVEKTYSQVQLSICESPIDLEKFKLGQNQFDRSCLVYEYEDAAYYLVTCKNSITRIKLHFQATAYGTLLYCFTTVIAVSEMDNNKSYYKPLLYS